MLTMIAAEGYATSALMGRIAGLCLLAVVLVIILKAAGLGKGKKKR